MINKIIGYISVGTLPQIPEKAITENDYCLLPDGTKIIEFDKNLFMSCTPFELPIDKWFGIVPDGTIERFPKEKEWVWRAQRSKRYIEELDSSIDPRSALKTLHGCASLMKIDLKTLLEELQAARKQNEPLQDVFARLRKSD